METSQQLYTRKIPLRLYSGILATGWALTVVGLLLWDIASVRQTTRELAIHVAKAHFDKDQAFRLWATSHGGVYVPIAGGTPPNPYLAHVPERDIETPAGTRLTLMNPAYMVRQLHGTFAELYGIYGHLTSLKPLRTENAPDAWEKKALEAFEQGTTQATEFTDIDGKPFLRLIKPMIAAKDCLKCHSDQSEGDIRGGVAIALPLKNFLDAQQSEIQIRTFSYATILVIGLVGIGAGTARIRRHEGERDQALEALGANEKKYRALFEDCKDGVFITTRDGKFIEGNQSLLDIFGLTRDDLPEADVQSLYADPAGRAKFQALVERTGSVNNYEIRCRRKDGRQIDCVMSGNVRVSGDGTVVGYQGIVRDITEQKRADAALKRQAQELERSNTDLEEFAFVASHDLQEPLRNVASCVTLLERSCKDKLDANAGQLMAYAVQSVGTMRALINDLLSYARISTKGAAFEPTDCEKVLGQVRANLRAAMGRVGATVTSSPLPTVPADQTQILQLLQNLIGNAIKFHGSEAPRVHVSAVENEQEWLFSVEDNGIGMEARHLERIFLIFQRLHRKSDYDGTGIGLAIAKKIVDRHGGRIWVESQIGVGTTFFFTLPKEVQE
jgi:two-component system, chemotaxis family, sensor kinase Cph1